MSKEHLPSFPRRLLICGASARAAAFSALRAGIEPLCADLFADVDLARVGSITRIPNYPDDIAATVADMPPADWIYTGALENFPQTVAQIAKQRRLLGNGPAVLTRVRDPLALTACLQDHGLPALQVRAQHQPPPADGTWLRKPLSSGGGANIRNWNSQTPSASPRQPVYYQRRGDGEAHSALFLAISGGAELIGISRQLVGVSEFHAAPFAYCGSLTPVQLPDGTVRQIQEMGECIATLGDMRGLFGCDFLYDGAAAWLTEVNPRYTASVEVYERYWNIPLLDWHCRACRADGEPATAQDIRRQISTSRDQQRHVAGKAIVFAHQTFNVPELEGRFAVPQFPWQPQIADIPAPGITIDAGNPICTVFANGPTTKDCYAQLVKMAATIGGAF